MALSFNNVTYKSNLKKFNYDFEDGKITTIVSGESLSYFTYLMSNLEKDYNGKITNTYKGRNIGVVFNNPEEAFIFNTVREELEFGLKKYNYKVSTINKRIEDSLKMVNLPKEYLDKIKRPSCCLVGRSFLIIKEIVDNIRRFRPDNREGQSR